MLKTAFFQARQTRNVSPSNSKLILLDRNNRILNLGHRHSSFLKAFFLRLNDTKFTSLGPIATAKARRSCYNQQLLSRAVLTSKGYSLNYTLEIETSVFCKVGLFFLLNNTLCAKKGMYSRRGEYTIMHRYNFVPRK